MTTFGARLSAARTAAGLTQADLAACVFRSRASIANMEADRQQPSGPVLMGLAAALGVAAEDLLVPVPVPQVVPRATPRPTIRLADCHRRRCEHCDARTVHVGLAGTCLQCIADGGTCCSLARYNRWPAGAVASSGGGEGGAVRGLDRLSPGRPAKGVARGSTERVLGTAVPGQVWDPGDPRVLPPVPNECYPPDAVSLPADAVEEAE